MIAPGLKFSVALFFRQFAAYAIQPLPVLSVCLSVLSVTLEFCSQTVVWNKTKLGLQVVLGPGHIVLDGHPAPLP